MLLPHLIGDYRIQRVLRNESTGVVYLGTHIVLPRVAAVKLMHASADYLRSMAVQMMREACILETLACPGAPRVYECGMIARRPWIAFENIDGPSLAEVLVEGPLHGADLVAVVRDVADTLAQLHALGAVHGRVSEESIVRSPSGRATLRDWSCAGTVDSDIATHDPSDDVYMLGLAAFHAATGRGDRESLDHAAHVPAKLLSMIDAMLCSDATVRPTAATVYEHAALIDEPASRERRWTPVYGSLPLSSTDGLAAPARAKQRS